jgi:hypothetical protein
LKQDKVKLKKSDKASKKENDCNVSRVSVFPPKFFSHGNGKNWELGNFSLGIPGNFSKS